MHKLKTSQKDRCREFITLTQVHRLKDFPSGFFTITLKQVHHKIFHLALLNFSQTGEKTALYCLTQHDWKLDIALDNYFANPEAYYRWVFATQCFSLVNFFWKKGT